MAAIAGALGLLWGLRNERHPRRSRHLGPSGPALRPVLLEHETMKISPWRVQWHECGWSSRWLIVRDRFTDRRLELLNEGYTKESDARAALALIFGA